MSWTFPEVDPACGPGTYVFTALTLALSAPAGTPSVSFVLALYRNSGSEPTTNLVLGSGIANLVYGTVPAYYTVTLPSTFTIDASADTPGTTTYTIAWKPQSAVTWWVPPSNFDLGATFTM